jgi:hypothetical protein
MRKGGSIGQLAQPGLATASPKHVVVFLLTVLEEVVKGLYVRSVSNVLHQPIDIAGLTIMAYRETGKQWQESVSMHGRESKSALFMQGEGGHETQSSLDHVFTWVLPVAPWTRVPGTSILCLSRLNFLKTTMLGRWNVLDDA